MNDSRYARALQSIGMDIVGETLFCDRPYTIARKGEFTVYFSENGTARLDKPNRTTKWVYEKSPAQLRIIARQVLSFYYTGR